VGTQAWFAYQNSLGGLYGRQFRVESGDDNFDTGTNRSAHRSLKDKVFAFSGSFSLFDAASVGEMKSVGVVDIGRALSPARQDYERHYSMVPFGIGWPTTGCQWLKDRFGDQVIKNMAIFWGNADAARDNASWQRAACESVGFEFKYSRQVEATESNFTADVVQMRRQNIQGFFIIYDASGIGRFLADMESQGYDPPLQYPSPAAYDSDLVKFAGKAGVEGIIIGQNMSMFLGEDAVAVPEIVTFNEWVRRIDPNQKFDLFALYGWAAGQLLTNAMTAAGPEVTREKVLAELAKTTSYNASGLHSVHNVAAKAPSVCEMYMEGTADGGFRRIFPDTGFYCEGTFHQYTG
jgi:ABC-type branched-subunit amino acid transport system substrate-binding protein